MKARSSDSTLTTSDHPVDVSSSFPVYEAEMDKDSRWALSEGSRHFDKKSAVFNALRKVTKRLGDLKIPYAVVGGMALFEHGLRRFTEDVDILVTRDDLKKIHHELDGLGYVPPHRNSKHLRDTELGVKIEFLTTGDYPGDGKPKPVSFPDPRSASVELGGISYVNLPILVELKLASGMTNPSRLKDLADVLELIKLINLSADFSEQLNPYVRDKYAELWGQARTRYITLWRNKWLTAQAETLDEMIMSLKGAARDLDSMRRDGVVLEEGDGTADDYALLVTTDPDVAKKYGMLEESEFWSVDEEGSDEEEDDS